MKQFTPAPWAYDGHFVTGSDGKALHNINRTASERDANAHLISAAPELYEQLLFTYSMLKIGRKPCGLNMDMIKEALNKANPEDKPA